MTLTSRAVPHSRSPYEFSAPVDDSRNCGSNPGLGDASAPRPQTLPPSVQARTPCKAGFLSVRLGIVDSAFGSLHFLPFLAADELDNPLPPKRSSFLVGAFL